MKGLFALSVLLMSLASFAQSTEEDNSPYDSGVACQGLTSDGTLVHLQLDLLVSNDTSMKASGKLFAYTGGDSMLITGADTKIGEEVQYPERRKLTSISQKSIKLVDVDLVDFTPFFALKTINGKNAVSIDHKRGQKKSILITVGTKKMAATKDVQCWTILPSRCFTDREYDDCGILSR
ncbi:MAG TPA: hypothetical protein VNJ01_13395 [Bacteriovoracaceae bacterium]|nr:hypothetical protein [Bacteriovoracaceae bacterium]